MSSSYHVRTEELYRALETISGQIEEWQDQLTQVQQAVETTKMTMSVQGETGDSIRSYLTEVQVPVIKGIRQVLEEYVMRLAGYIIGYQGIDTQMDAELCQSSLEDQYEKLLSNQGNFQKVVESVNSAIAGINDIASVTKPDGSTADSSYSGLIMYVQNLNQQIGEYEETHKNDCQPVNEMIQTIQSIIASRTGIDTSASTYVPGSYVLNPAYSKLKQQMETSNKYTKEDIENVPILQEVSMEIDLSELDDILEKLGIVTDNPVYDAIKSAAIGHKDISLLVNGVTFIVDDTGKVHLSGKIMDGIKDANGTIHKWDEQGIGKVLKELGVEIGTEGFNKSSLKNWSMDGIAIKNLQIDTPNQTIDRIKALAETGGSRAAMTSKMARGVFREGISIWDDFSPEVYKKVSKIGKAGHVLGAIGTLVTVGSNVSENMIDDYGNLNITPDSVQDTISDSAVDIVSGAGAMAAGMAIGTAAFPGVGTVAGAVIGFVIGGAINGIANLDVKDMDGDGEKDSLVDITKLEVDSFCDWVGNLLRL